MRIKTTELTGAALDWAVAICEGYTNLRKNPHPFATPNSLIMDPPHQSIGPTFFRELNFSTNWGQGGPIIDREKIHLRAPEDACKPDGTVVLHIDFWYARKSVNYDSCVQNGPTALIAAMRCYVASKYRDEIEIPDELALTIPTKEEKP